MDSLFADRVLLIGKIITVDPEDLLDVQVLKTIADGKMVYER
jgi:predicted amidohydrolase YtcJ